MNTPNRNAQNPHAYAIEDTRTLNFESVKSLFNKDYQDDSKRSTYDQVNVRLPAEINDWLNHIVRETKRVHGSKFPKEVIIETALEFIQYTNLNWANIRNKNDLLKELLNFCDKYQHQSVK